METRMIVVDDADRVERKVDWPLWFGVLGGPLAWTAHLIVCYLLVIPVCQDGGILGLHLISLGLTLIAAATGIVSWRIWRRSLDTADVGVHGTGGRRSFMAFYGMLSGILFTASIIVAWIPIFLINPCAGV
jgi:hypothetical protein